jgi:hypothetical protein
MRHSPDDGGRRSAHRLSRPRRMACALAIAATASCVSYDPVGPPVPSIEGTYGTTITVQYSNYLETLTDTLAGSVTVWNSNYRGHFHGYYSIRGDSGSFGGALRPEGTMTVTDWGAPPKPIADVGALRRLYPWCDFSQLGTGPLPGSLRADTLTADGAGSLPCYYHLFGQVVDIGAQLQIHIVGVR